MTRIHGQIESLKRIREILDQEGITRFNSVTDINNFLNNYDNEKEELIFNTERQFDLELEVLQTKWVYLQKDYEELKIKTENNLSSKITQLKTKCEALSYPARNAIWELLNWYQQQILLTYKFILEKNNKSIIWLKTYPSKKRLDTILKKVDECTMNRQEIIFTRCAPKFKELDHAKTVATDLYPIIVGAMGEHKVAKELEKLPDTCVLINDFSLTFEKPIYNKKENNRIFSIQIDHLLVTHAGIFIIETKNWSKASLERYDLRSPVRQIQRTSFALFVLLNSQKQDGGHILKKHHWGHKKIPIKNIVAMIHHKPREKFNYVAIKTLKELNGYIEHFESIFDSLEVRNIADYLLKLKN